MNGLRGVCPAKLNLALAVTGRRDDGYHTLRSVFLLLDLHDDLEAALAEEPSGPDELVVAGGPDTPMLGNLVLSSASLLRTTFRRPLPALRFRLTKRIPTAAGLGGGSSDAAAALALAAHAWGLEFEPRERLAMAAQLGADVPFFLAGYAAAFVAGIGEDVRPLPAPTTPVGVLLVTPTQRLSTAHVFAEFDREPARSSGDSAQVERLHAAMRAGLDARGLVAAADQLAEANQLWSAAARLSPGLVSTREQLSVMLERPVMLTGSGPTLFALYASGTAAATAAAELEAKRLPQLDGATIIATTSHPGGLA